ncbi:RDD family protein [Streptomyces polyrhachis]|uniref:RDD family protein n=1 Tax=Streptomyces polyrhachis TaxID=1282885 RepID=A0ABW2GCF3_9ACTN
MSLDQSAPSAPAVRPKPALHEMAPLAPTGLRFTARVLDSLVLAVLWFVSATVTGLFGEVMEAQRAGGSFVEQTASVDPVRAVLAFALTYLVYFLYEGALLARSGQTLGKKAVGIRVAVLSDGDIPGQRGWTRAAVYALPGVLGGAPGLSLLGQLFWLTDSLWFLRDRPYRQALHDKAAKTVVVRA